MISESRLGRSSFAHAEGVRGFCFFVRGALARSPPPFRLLLGATKEARIMIKILGTLILQSSS